MDKLDDIKIRNLRSSALRKKVKYKLQTRKRYIYIYNWFQEYIKNSMNQ